MDVRENGHAAQWITDLTVEQLIAGLTPVRVDGAYFKMLVVLEHNKEVKKMVRQTKYVLYTKHLHNIGSLETESCVLLK